MEALLFVLVLVAVWLASSAGRPYTACSASACEAGKVRSPGRRSRRTCRRCRRSVYRVALTGSLYTSRLWATPGTGTYSVCMSRLNVWVPDELASEARAAGLNISALTRAAIESELAGRATDEWLESLPEPRSDGPSDEDVLRALDEAREEFGAERG